MRILGLNITRDRTETRAAGMTQPLNDPSASLLQLLLSASQGSSSGVVVTPLSSLGAATVFACVRALATTFSTLPVEVTRPEGGCRVAVPDHPVTALLDVAPNPYMTTSDMLSACEVNLNLSGRAFIEVQRSLGVASALYPLEPQRVGVNVMNAEVLYNIDGRGVARADLAHLRGLTFDGLAGINTTQAVKDAIGLALALQENANKFFGNGSRPGATLEHPAQLSAEAQKRLRDSIEEQTGGKNANRLLILEEGMKFTAMRSENKDSQFLESRDRQDLEICRIFGVPPHKVGIMQGQPRANVEQDNISFVSEVIEPKCVKYGQELTRVLLTPDEVRQGYRITISPAKLLRGDMLTRYRAYSIGRQWGWLSANDVRKAEGLPPIEDGDEYIDPSDKGGEGSPTMLDDTEATKSENQKDEPTA